MTLSLSCLATLKKKRENLKYALCITTKGGVQLQGFYFKKMFKIHFVLWFLTEAG